MTLNRKTGRNKQVFVFKKSQKDKTFYNSTIIVNIYVKSIVDELSVTVQDLFVHISHQTCLRIIIYLC